MPSSTSITPLLSGWAVNGLLGGGNGVDGGHETFDDAKVVMDNLGQWSQAVGGARGVAKNRKISTLTSNKQNKYFNEIKGPLTR